MDEELQQSASDDVGAISESADVDAEHVKELRLLLLKLRESLDAVEKALDAPAAARALRLAKRAPRPTLEDRTFDRVIEGIFNGEAMVGADGQTYVVPANYASKSKLVEGDVLKLSITSSGDHIYKIIGPTERKRIVAQLVIDPDDGAYFAVADGQRWKILTASATFYHAAPGDQVVVLIPRLGSCRWAAVEAILKRPHHDYLAS